MGREQRKFRRFLSSGWTIGLSLTFIMAIFLADRFYPNRFSALSDKGLAGYHGRSISFLGWVCAEADRSFNNQRLTVCSGSSRVLITTDLRPSYDYGDFLEVSGYLQAPGMIEGFNYQAYLARYGIASLMYYPRLSLSGGRLSSSQVSYRRLLDFKQSLKMIMDRSLPEPEAGLASALLLGYRRTIDQEDADSFARAGISHMIAISGSHITIMGGILMSLATALGLGKRLRIPLVLSFIIFYPVFTGLSASAVRASIMGGLSLLALSGTGKRAASGALIISAALMVAANPRILGADIGFQLSFLAVSGLIHLYPYFEALYASRFKSTKPGPRLGKGVLDIISMTIASQIFILPVALANFDQFSLVAPLTNILILWTFPFILSLLMLALALSAVFPQFSLAWFFLSYALLHYVIIASRFLADLPGAALPVSGFSWIWGAAYYTLLATFLYWLGKRRGHITQS